MQQGVQVDKADLTDSFLRPDEEAVISDFMQQGYVTASVSDLAALDAVRNEVVKVACDHLDMPHPADDGAFLNRIQDHVGVDRINDLRLKVYGEMNKRSWFRPTYYRLARNAVDLLVGNELAMQNRINVSIQMPGDQSSVLDVHADAHSGETPFQVVAWLPLVDVFETKSMFIASPETNRDVLGRFHSVLEAGGTSAVLEQIAPTARWPKVDYGSVLVFSPNLLHGNVLNETDETRWSFNTRFTGLFTPYASAEKGLGAFYLPITTKAVTKLGLAYKSPGGFSDGR